MVRGSFTSLVSELEYEPRNEPRRTGVTSLVSDTKVRASFTRLVGQALRASYCDHVITSLVYEDSLVTSLVTRLVSPPVWGPGPPKHKTKTFSENEP